MSVAMNDKHLPDVENRIRGLFQTKYKDLLGLNLRVNVYRAHEGLAPNNNANASPVPSSKIVIEFVYNVHEDPPGPTFIYDRRRVHIQHHGDVLFESRRRSSRSRESPHLINTLDMSENQRAALTDRIRRECNRVFYGRSRGGATRRLRSKATRSKATPRRKVKN
jgi:hypothetical protein